MSSDELFDVPQQGFNIAIRHHVIAVCVFDIFRTGNLFCEIATYLDRNQSVRSSMKDQCGHSHRR